MIRITALKIGIHHTEDELRKKIIKYLKINNEDLLSYKIIKKSIDARKKPDIFYVYNLDINLKNEKKYLKNLANKKDVSLSVDTKFIIKQSKLGDKKRPIVVGFGPAGIFAALVLAKSGLSPIVIERGEDADKRLKSVIDFWEGKKVNTDSNVSFGEGGAGTFSDGKLNTLVKDNKGYNRFVLETLYKYGADEDILINNKPHIGTDKLISIIKGIRKEIISLGGDILFNTKLIDFEFNNNKLHSIKVLRNKKEEILKCDKLILAIGHSARDTFFMLYDKGIDMMAKPFAVGLRVIHPQELIDISQYGEKEYKYLSPASYKLTAQSSNARSVYSFCMCPGGFVVNASTEENMLCINGMSYNDRASKNANSAIIVNVKTDDFSDKNIVTPIDAIKFQQNLEKKFYNLANGNIPVQNYIDFVNNDLKNTNPTYDLQIKGKYTFAKISDILPEFIYKAICDGMCDFDKKIKGFASNDAWLLGVETRTSSPIRINRDEQFNSNIAGIYPCGEGAGFAGGIMSAAMDGIKVADYIIKHFED